MNYRELNECERVITDEVALKTSFEIATFSMSTKAMFQPFQRAVKVTFS